MRTTVEIKDEQYARLLALAAQRGEKGVSKLVQEALEKYIEDHDRRVRDAISVLGRLDEETARELEATSQRLTKTWR